MTIKQKELAWLIFKTCKGDVHMSLQAINYAIQFGNFERTFAKKSVKQHVPVPIVEALNVPPTSPSSPPYIVHFDGMLNEDKYSILAALKESARIEQEHDWLNELRAYELQLECSELVVEVYEALNNNLGMTTKLMNVLRLHGLATDTNNEEYTDEIIQKLLNL